MLALTIPNILQNQQLTSALYLAHVYQLHSAQQNGSQAFIQSSLSNPTKLSSKKRQIKTTPNRASQPVVHGVKMPLERFFSQYSKFKYQPTISPVVEFNRLCEEYGWEKNDRKKEAARHEFGFAMKKEFDTLYGADEKDINNWYKLCHVLRIDPIPDTLKKCRAVSSQLHRVFMFSFEGVTVSPRLSVGSTSISSTLWKDPEKTSRYSNRRKSLVHILKRMRNIFRGKVRQMVECCARSVAKFFNHGMVSRPHVSLMVKKNSASIQSC